jgi:HSP20 family protein
MYRTMLTAPVFGLRREIDRLFEDTFANSSDRTGWAPPVNIRETSDGFSFDIELAGFKPEDVELTCDNGVLTVRGERHEERKEGDEGRYHLVERRYGEFSRSFQLPQGVKEDNIHAEFDNGLLRVQVPKAEIPQPKKISIQGAAQGRREGQAAIRGSSNAEARSGNADGNGSSSKDGGSKSRQNRGEMAGSGSR